MDKLYCICDWCRWFVPREEVSEELRVAEVLMRGHSWYGYCTNNCLSHPHRFACKRFEAKVEEVSREL